MGKRIFRTIRLVELLVCGLFVVVGALPLLAPKSGAYKVTLAVWAFAAFAALMFEWRARGLRRSIARVTAELETIRARDLESATPVAEREAAEFEGELAANPAFARMLAGRAARLFVKGTWRGARLDVGTAIVANRDFDTMVSHVLVETTAIRSSFRLMTKGAITRFSRMGMKTNPTSTGDATFDEGWVADADHEAALFVLDEATRRELVELSRRLPWMGVASVEATRLGLIFRWPGELSAESAAYFRDLTTRMAERLQQHDQKG